MSNLKVDEDVRNWISLSYSMTRLIPDGKKRKQDYMLIGNHRVINKKDFSLFKKEVEKQIMLRYVDYQIDLTDVYHRKEVKVRALSPNKTILLERSFITINGIVG